MSHNVLQLNKDKTEILVIHNDVRRGSIASHLDSLSLKTSNQAKNLGTIFDSDLSFKKLLLALLLKQHIITSEISPKYVTVSPLLTVRNLFMHLLCLDLTTATVFLLGYQRALLKHLQRVQNAAAWMLTRCKTRNHITPTLRSLHWLTVFFWIEFNILLLVIKCLHVTAPIYLSNLLNKYTPVRSLRTSKYFKHASEGSILCIFYSPDVSSYPAVPHLPRLPFPPI